MKGFQSIWAKAQVEAYFAGSPWLIAVCLQAIHSFDGNQYGPWGLDIKGPPFLTSAIIKQALEFSGLQFGDLAL
jgi:hypothetical protein